MDYGKLLTRTWRIIQAHPFLILLGVLVALSGGGGGASALRGYNMGSGSSGPRFGGGQGITGPLAAAEVLVVLLIVLLIGLALVVAIALWAASTIAGGGLIASVNSIESDSSSRFAAAWGAGWQRGWPLIGIGIIPAIPGLLLVIAGVGVLLMVGGAAQVVGGRVSGPAIGGLVALALATLCVVLPVSVALNVLRDLANRACMLEDLGVIDSYRRAWEIVSGNLGEVIILFLIQVAINIGVGILLIFPGFILLLCCCLWPLFLLIRGAVTAYISTIWTLAWREWTGLGAVSEPAGDTPALA